jgi:hypothetical protein
VAIPPNPTAPSVDSGRLLLSAKEVAELCGLGRHAALELMHRAGAVVIGRRVRVRPADLDAYFVATRTHGEFDR